jgi:hypothetical protein
MGNKSNFLEDVIVNTMKRLTNFNLQLAWFPAIKTT